MRSAPKRCRSGRTACGAVLARTAIAAGLAGAACTAFGQVPAPPASAAGAPTEAPQGAQRWVSQFTVKSQATLTSNASYGTSDAEKDGDLILELTPSWRFNRQGGRLRVDGSVSLDMLGYVGGTQVSRLLPRADVLANLEAIDNFFYIDGSIRVDQFLENPYLASSSGISTDNIYTNSQFRLAPYFRGNIGPNVRWLVRSDNSYTWSSQSSAPLQNAYHVRNLAEVVRAPTPLGLTLRVSHDLTRLQDQLQPDQTLSTALAIADYAVSSQVKVGLRGGYERTTYVSADTSGPIYGANVTWQPSPLTSFGGFWEERFYGPSYEYQLSHRHRRLASTIGGYRTVATYPQLLFRLPTTSNVAGLVDAIFVARFPDPVERARQVQDFIAQQGLPASLAEGAYVYNQSVNVLTGANATWGLAGIRNTLGLNIFYLKTEHLPDARVPPTFLVFNDSVQQGATVTFSHRLTPVVALNATADTRRTKGFEQTAGRNARDSGLSIQSSWRASPRTDLFVGARYRVRKEDRVSADERDASETAIYAGMFHRL